MEEELNLFFGFLENDKKVSNNTLQSYERDLKQYERYLSEQGKEYKEETNEGIKEYITYMQEIGKKSSTISRGLASIRSFYQYGVKNKDVENDPTEGISSPKIEKRVPSVLTSSEVALLLDQPKNVDLKGTRDKAMLEFAYATGMRVTEIISLNVEDVDLEKGFATCRNGKKERTVPLGEMSLKALKDYVENGFLTLPKGCYIQLEKEAKEYILRNIKSASNTKTNLLSKLRSFKNDTDLELTLENFLEYHNLSLVDFYGKTRDRSFARMCVMAEQREDFVEENEIQITKKLYNLLFVNSRRFIEFVIRVIKNNDNISNIELTSEEGLMLNMMYYIFYNDAPEKMGLTSIKEGINKLLNNKVMMNEACEILEYNFNHLNFVDKKVDLGFDCPLDLHCDYSTDAIMAAFGYYNEEKKPAFREGVKYFEDKGIDIFFITLNKSDKDFSPSTLYEDYAINEKLFHWQTQSKTSAESTTGKRYINHLKTGNKIALFVREYKSRDGLTSPFTYLGTCEYRSHTGNKPISFVWELNEEIPPSMINKANKTIII